jgi:hypothetical protein
MSRLRMMHLMATFGAIGVVLVGGILFVSTRRDDPTVNCDAPLPSLAAWAAGGDAQTDEGYRLAECGRLIGLAEVDVERLLGPAVRDSGALTWQMGPDGLGIDFMFLDVTVETGRVTAVSVGQG